MEPEAGAQARLRDVLARGFGLDGAAGADIGRVESGRVNETYVVSLGGGPRYVLQKLNSLFGPAEALGENWNRVGLALADSGVGFPRIFPASGGGWLFRDPGGLGAAWRLTAFLPGRAPRRDSQEEASLAAATLGRCHAALNRPRPIGLMPALGGGDFTNQKRCLPSDFEAIASSYRGHPNLEAIAPDVGRGRMAAAWLPGRPAFARVFAARDLVVHLDCKSDNFLIGQGLESLIDWDTVGYGDPLLDIGEMCRSWAVSATRPFYDASMASAIVGGYRQAGLGLSPAEYRFLPAVVRALALNLARRYLADALAETYFRWDSDAYPSLHEQNASRGRHMLDLAEELLERDMELSDI
ncbi:MAG: aminoglycoside phosphotransferase family protein [Deltaproteobacteria bacterium]|nr:aminoglycoside phosphotransferase family protein [Deltaproteobacteria bacterium]